MRQSVLPGTDDGLAAIGARFSVAAGVGVGQGAGDVAGDVFGRPRPIPNPVRQVPLFIPVPIATDAGLFTGLIGFQGPPQGWYWSVRRLTGQGFSAGTVSVFESSVNGEPLAELATAGVPSFYNRGGVLLHPQSYLVVQASDITGTVTVFGAVDAVPDWYLSAYLG